ncbi:hypothetical protein BDF21DRAFT_456164 [Thamnidium elegans]|nr:hypothetical protein BDF21DRAFT_456164 [Thamnidium elegans]
MLLTVVTEALALDQASVVTEALALNQAPVLSNSAKFSAISRLGDTADLLPGKLMEYLWRRANKVNIKAGMERCLCEVSFNNNIASREIENDDTGIITRGENGNPPEVEAAYQARAAVRRAADLRRYLARNRRTNTGYEEDLARVMLGRAYEVQQQRSNAAELESDESSSEDSDFSFGDSDVDYDFNDNVFASAPPPPINSSLIPTSSSSPLPTVSPPPSSPVPTVSSPVVSNINPIPAIPTRGRPRGTSNIRRGRGRGCRANTTSRTSRR